MNTCEIDIYLLELWNIEKSGKLPTFSIVQTPCTNRERRPGDWWSENFKLVGRIGFKELYESKIFAFTHEIFWEFCSLSTSAVIKIV